MKYLLTILVALCVACSNPCKKSAYKFSIGEQTNLVLPDGDEIPVTISKTKCVNDHRYYMVRDEEAKLLEVAEEELY